MTDPVRPDIYEFILESVAKVSASGIAIGPLSFGVFEDYDGEFTLHWQKLPEAPTVCPLGAAAICTLPIPKSKNGKIRKADRTERALAVTLGMPTDYVFGFAQGFDGHSLWANIDYQRDFRHGYTDGQRVAAYLKETATPSSDAA